MNIKQVVTTLYKYTTVIASCTSPESQSLYTHRIIQTPREIYEHTTIPFVTWLYADLSSHMHNLCMRHTHWSVISCSHTWTRKCHTILKTFQFRLQLNVSRYFVLTIPQKHSLILSQSVGWLTRQ